jgi:release factor glutamine methyltransferase
MRPAEVIRRGGDYLDRHGVESPVPTAELLLASILDTDRATLYARAQGLSTAQAKAFGRALCRRCSGTPLQHLTGEQGFRRLVLAVRPGVFIPRPETEVLVQVGLATISGMQTPVVVDVGTGAGAVALAVADEHPGAVVWATDLSTEAVALASQNARKADLNIRVVEGDLMAPLPSWLLGGVDLILSNPPYIPRETQEMLPQDVRADPPLALYGSLEIYRRIAGEATRWLRPGGALALEIEETQAEAVSTILREAGFGPVTVSRDLAGRDRVLNARRSLEPTQP